MLTLKDVTALMISAVMGKEETAALLLKAGANVNQCNQVMVARFLLLGHNLP
jgi:ankyrin repeat protein